MPCTATTLSESLSQLFCGTDYRSARLALAGQLYLQTGIDAQTAMQAAKCYCGMDDQTLNLIVLAALCYGGQ